MGVQTAPVSSSRWPAWMASVSKRYMRVPSYGTDTISGWRKTDGGTRAADDAYAPALGLRITIRPMSVAVTRCMLGADGSIIGGKRTSGWWVTGDRSQVTVHSCHPSPVTRHLSPVTCHPETHARRHARLPPHPPSHRLADGEALRAQTDRDEARAGAAPLHLRRPGRPRPAPRRRPHPPRCAARRPRGHAGVEQLPPRGALLRGAVHGGGAAHAESAALAGAARVHRQRRRRLGDRRRRVAAAAPGDIPQRRALAAARDRHERRRL